MSTAPAYGQIQATRPYVFGSRKLAAGDVVIDVRAPGGAADLKTFIDLLRWSAFKVVPVAPPQAPKAQNPSAISDEQLANLRNALAETEAAKVAMAARVQELEAALHVAHLAGPMPPADLAETPIEPALALLIKRIQADALCSLTGVKPAAAKALKEWADDFAVTADEQA